MYTSYEVKNPFWFLNVYANTIHKLAKDPKHLIKSIDYLPNF